jgi:hypothetical protein
VVVRLYWFEKRLKEAGRVAIYGHDEKPGLMTQFAAITLRRKKT